MAKADADRGSSSGGTQVAFQRLLERLRPHRQGLGGDSQSNHGTSGDPGR